MKDELKNFTAKEARECYSTKGALKLEGLLAEIESAAYDGVKGIKRVGFISSETIKELEKRNFKVRVKSDDFRQTTEIMW